MPSVRARGRQAKASAALNAQARYDAAGTGRRIARWSPPTSGPRAAIEGTSKLLARARDSARNDWSAEAGTGRWVSNLVGVGIQPRWKNKAVREIWDAWVPEADADGVLDVYGQQALATRAWLEAGECFLRRRPRSLATPLSVPVQIQVLESEQLPMRDADVWPGMPEGHRMIQGIEVNRFGRRIAYWFYKEHPGEKNSTLVAGQNDLIRVLADDVAHVFEPKRPGQMRGVSDLAPVLVKLRSIADFEDAVLDRQKLANLFTVFFTRALPPEWEEVQYDPNTGLPVWYDNEGQPMAGLEPGISQTLQPGEDVKFANPPEAGTSYPDYMRMSHVGTAAGRGMPYELMTGDIKDVSDRTLRIVVQEFRRFASQRQWHVLIHQMVRNQVRWMVEGAALAGLLSATAAKAALTPTYAPHAWEYIHPTQDAQGKQLLLEMGVVSKSQLIAERGDDPDKVFEERAEDQKTEDDLGLTPPEPAPAPPPATEAAQARLLDAQAEAARRTPPAPPPDRLPDVFAALLKLEENRQAAEARRAADEDRRREEAAAAEARRREDLDAAEARRREEALASEQRLAALLAAQTAATAQVLQAMQAQAREAAEAAEARTQALIAALRPAGADPDLKSAVLKMLPGGRQ